MVNENPVITLKLTEIDKNTIKILLNQKNTVKYLDISGTRIDKKYLVDLCETFFLNNII